MRFNLDALELDALTAPADGQPLMLDVDSIDEDPDQPRSEFDDEPLQELAASITERGVLQAISVRRHPEREGRWIVNFGARRLRASRLAGRTSIPAQINDAPDAYAQVIENEQREGLKPFELAAFVKKRLAAGERQADIARKLGKSRAFVTYAAALIDAPDWLLQAYKDGKCSGMRQLYELRAMHDAAPQKVEQRLGSGAGLTRADLRLIKQDVGTTASTHSKPSSAGVADALVTGAMPLTPPKASVFASPAATRSTGKDSAAWPSESQFIAKPSLPSSPRSWAPGVDVWLLWNGREVRLDLTRLPDEPLHVHVWESGQSGTTCVPLVEVRLARVVPISGDPDRRSV